MEGGSDEGKDLDVTRTSDHPAAAQPSPNPNTAGALRVPAPLQLRDAARYELLGEHGRGGLGRVLRAHDKELGRDVAIKELLERTNTSEVRFFREALITARLEHPNIVPVHEAGRWADGTSFYAMKLVSGRPLRELIDAASSAARRLALLSHVIAVADAIAYAHDRRVIHRDLKPSNVIVGEFGETVVIDWGLAKVLDEPDGPADAPYRTAARDELTAAGSVLGTPAYMAPEQHEGKSDARVDVYAIGAMLWEVCVGGMLGAVAEGARAAALERARIDRDLTTIIAKAIAADPARRYRDAGELAADLNAFEAGLRIGARTYTPPALVARWVRRHRALALSLAGTLLLALAGSIVYVRNITVERDRADAALAEAETQRRAADAERDRAQLSEAALLLEKDPTRAHRLLAAMRTGDPQRALLRSRAAPLAAIRTIEAPGGVMRMARHPITSELVIVTNHGALESIDLETGARRQLDFALLGPLAAYGNGWIYARRPFGAPEVTLAGTTPQWRRVGVGPLLGEVTGTLLNANGRIYALDNRDLHVIEASGAALVQRGVHSIAGDARLVLACTEAGELEIGRDRAVERRGRCLKSTSVWPMAAAGDDYAAMLDATRLLVVRDGRALELPVHVTGEYELAMASSGLVALADFDGRPWLLRPSADQLELGPTHSSTLTSVAADGSFAAWGYTDGTVIAFDTRTETRWEFTGHGEAVERVILDVAHRRMVSQAGEGIRVWALAPSPLIEIAKLPSTVFNIVRSPDGREAAFDCDDGGVRVWTLASGSLREVHRHASTSWGIAWLDDEVCSGGFDGRVLCTDPAGATREILSGTGKVNWLAGTDDHHRIAIATDDGRLRSFDGTLHELYAHTAVPYRMAFSPDGRLLASGASDGSVIVYDVAHQRVLHKIPAHRGLVMAVAWRQHEVWTSGVDGELNHWHADDPDPVVTTEATEAPSFRFLHVFADGGWSGAVAGKQLIVRAGAPDRTTRFDLDRHIEHVTVSPDERYLATTISDEVIVLDRRRSGVASLRIPTNGIGYVGFISSDLLAINAASRLYTVELAALDYVTFAPSSVRTTKEVR